MLTAGDIIERYEVEHVIGVGGMATVYSVKHRLLGSRHALKVLRDATVLTARQFIKEGRIQARIDPENVVPVTDVILVDGAPALVMPLVEGCSLGDVLREYQPTEAEISAIIYAVTCGIASAHEIGVIHLDLKPSNVLLDVKHGRVRVRVADFGLAQQREDAPNSSEVFMGTPGFAAPEQYVQPEQVDRRADLWAIGAILVHMLTGEPPYRADTPRATYALMESNAYDMSKLPAQWRDLARRLLERDVRLRADDLDAVLEQIRALDTVLTIRVGSPLVDAIEKARARSEDALRSLPVLAPTRFDKGQATPQVTAKQSQKRVLPSSGNGMSGSALSSQADSRPPSAELSSLPTARDVFVGRSRELLDFESLLSESPRLVTILGMGGTGKTRFALQYAWKAKARWPGGVLFCDLTEARNASDVCVTLASALGIPLVSDNDIELLGQSLAAREPSLIIFDNFEQIVDVAQITIDRWIQQSPKSVFVVTSRIVLSLGGERTFPLEPLNEPDSVSLFIERARKVRPDYSPSTVELEDVAALVALLDCLPLAIELAAARSRVLSTEKIVARLSDRFQLLKSNEFKTRRQATLRGAIDWSWDLLSEWERSTLAQVSVFEGGFDLEAIEHVVSFDGMPNAPWPVDVIQALVEQSLIRPTGDDRFDLLVSVREYAAEKLAAVSQGANVHDRHAEYFAEFGAKEAVEAIYRHGGVQVSDRMVLEYDNLKAALLHGAKSGNKAVALACFRAVITVIERRGPFAEAHELTSRLLDSLSLTRHERGDCLVLQGRIERLSGHREKATKYLSEAAAIGRELQDPTLEVRGLRNLAFLLFYKDEMHAADEAWERSEALARRHRLVIELSAYLVERCDIFFGQGETKQGMAMLQEGMALAREVGNDSVLMLALTIMSYKDPESSAELLGEALRIARAWRDIRSECSIYPALGYAAVNRGDIQKAYAYYLKSLRLSMNVGATFRSAITLTCLCELSLMLANHDDARDYALRAAAYGEDSWVFFKGVSNGILAMLAIYEGRYEDALALLEIAESLTHAASHRSETAKLMTVKAQALHLMGRTKEAAAQYQAVVRLIRDDGALEPYQVWLSEGYLKMIGQG